MPYSIRVRNVSADFLTAQRGRFVLFLPVFMAGGILAYFAWPTEPALPVTVGSAAALAAAALGVWRWPVPRALTLCAAFAAAGPALAGIAAWRAAPWTLLPTHAVLLSGRVIQIELLPEGRRITVADGSLDGAPPAQRALRLRLRTSDVAPVATGDLVEVRALVRPPPPPDYPGGWDTQREAFFAGLAGYGFAIGPLRIVRPAGPDLLGHVREAVARRILADLPGSEGAIAATLLTGSGSAIRPSDRTAFQDSGLAHLLAVAGLHVGIVMGLVFALVRLALAAWERAALHWPTRRIAALASLAAGLAYLVLTGGHVPILRSFIMAALVTLAVLTSRRPVSLRGLAAAATLLMAGAPESVVGVSFQMSFSSVLVLVAGYEIARPYLLRHAQAAVWWRRPVLVIVQLALTSLLAGSASLPFAAAHFGKAALLYVPANMLAVPLAAFWIMPLGMAALALMPLGLERLALVPMGAGIRGLLAIAHFVAAWPAATVPVAQVPDCSLGLLAAGMIWACLWRGRLRLVGLAPALAGIGLAGLHAAPDLMIGPEARLIAVRQGSVILVESTRDASPLELQAPERLWGSAQAAPFSTAPGVVCTQAGCRVDLPGGTLQLVRDGGAADCSATVIVSAYWLHDPCPGTIVLDHATVDRNGAIAAWLAAPAVQVVADRQVRGSRPWVISPRLRLPMAPIE